MRVGYLKRDREERFNLKRGWFVNAWRIIDASGVDLVQPWFRTKGDAKNFASNHGITLYEQDV